MNYATLQPFCQSAALQLPGVVLYYCVDQFQLELQILFVHVVYLLLLLLASDEQSLVFCYQIG